MIEINFNKVVQYSKKNCVQKSKALCATYVKNAFAAGGCKYVSGNGWSNQTFCKNNDFQLIGDFVPIDKNPRAHNNIPIQFPDGYVQQTGDICLIKHGTYGHICYATGTGINDWVSDYFQRPPGQQSGTGPYCYSGSVERVQFWRHSSVIGTTPLVTETSSGELSSDEIKTSTSSSTQSSNSSVQTGTPNTIQNWSSSTKKKNKGGTELGSHMKQK